MSKSDTNTGIIKEPASTPDENENIQKDGIVRTDFLKKIGVGLAATSLLPLCTSSLLATSNSPTNDGGLKPAGRWGMLVDLNRCYGCKACAIACKAEFDVRLGVYNSNVIEYEHGKYPKTTRSFLPWLCNHCSDAPCVDVCPADPVKKNFNGKTYDAKATYKRPDGMVLYDQNRCLGCHACVEECPYKARYVDPLLRAGEEPDNQAIGKCTFCQHRVDRGLEPSCVNTCPGNARIFGDLDDPNAAISKIIKKNKNRVKGLKEGYGTHPNVFYLNLFEDTYTHGSDIRNNAPASGGQNRKA